MHKKVTSKTTRKSKKTNKPWFNSLCKESKDNFKDFKKSLPNTCIYINRLAIKQHAKRYKHLLRKEKYKFDKEFNEKLLEMRDWNSSAFWKIINKDRKNTKAGDIQQEILFDHFSNLSKPKPNPNPNPNIITPESQPEIPNDSINNPFSLKEIKKHISLLKNNKSPGVDHILNKFIKNCPE